MEIKLSMRNMYFLKYLALVTLLTSHENSYYEINPFLIRLNYKLQKKNIYMFNWSSNLSFVYATLNAMFITFHKKTEKSFDSEFDKHIWLFVKTFWWIMGQLLNC